MSEMTVAQALAEAGKWGNLIRALSKLQETAEFLHAQEQLRQQREGELVALQSKIADAHNKLVVVNTEIARTRREADEAAERVITAADARAADAMVRAEAANDAVSKQAAAAAELQAAARAAQAELEEAQAELKRTRARTENVLAAAREQLGA